jgi:phosphoglycolate phosphatase
LNIRAAGVIADTTVMIGDTSFDMEMARAAQARAQGVSWGFHTLEEIESGGAHHIAHDFAELGRALDRFAARELAL